MPAIHPAKLKVQISELARIFQQPEIFIRRLNDLLEFYSDGTRRQGIVVTSAMLLNSLGVPRPVIHHLSIGMIPLVKENPDSTLSICDKLWNQPYIEHRMIAAIFLGHIPTSWKMEVMDRINTWRSEPFDEKSVRIILQKGMSALVSEFPGEVYKTAENWLSSAHSIDRQYAILLLDILVNNHGFENHPLVFRLITPHIRKTPREIRPLMPALVRSLVEKDVQETAFVLEEALQASDNPDATWITRQVLPHFPKEYQNRLRIILRRKLINAVK
jgi:hypothetical protein